MSNNSSNTSSAAAAPSTRRMRPLTIAPTPAHPQIILALNLIGTTPPKFHWLIFVPFAHQTNEWQVGHKLHAVDNGSVGTQRTWAFDASEFTLASSQSVAVGAVIGQVREGRGLAELEQMLSQIPLIVPAVDAHRESEFSCIVWIREALRRMHHHGFIRCPNVDAMEQEMWNYGRAAAQAIENDSFKIASLYLARNSNAVV